MKEYIKKCHGFEEDNITILMDDGDHTEPTSANIMSAFRTLVSKAEPGDACFLHYSGHGCSIRDDEREEADGMDEALCPIDFQKAGVLRDDDVFETLVAPLARDVLLTCVMDCCHSGTILDLPYSFLADGEQQEMQIDPEFDFGPYVEMVQAFAKAGLDGLKNLHQKGKERRHRRRNRWKNRLGL